MEEKGKKERLDQGEEKKSGGKKEGRAESWHSSLHSHETDKCAFPFCRRLPPPRQNWGADESGLCF